MSDVEFNDNLSFRNRNRFLDEFENASQLPTFNSQDEADKFFIALKDDRLSEFLQFLRRHNFFTPDYTPQSLKDLEKLYYKLHEENRFGDDLIKIEDFELYMSLYFGEVMVRNTSFFQWGAEKHFLTNNAYYLAIKKKLLSMGIARLKNYYNTKNNKTRQSLFRKYKSYST